MSSRCPAGLFFLCCVTIAMANAFSSTVSMAETPPAQADPIEADPSQGEEKKVVLTFKRIGGIAGFRDSLEIFSDSSYEIDLRPTAKVSHSGKLNADQQAMLKKLLATFGKVEWSRGNAPDVADGMQESITINGTGMKTTLSPKDPEFGQITKLATDVLRARP